ncbi:MAG: hypothetical protein ACN4GM_07075 [Gammaproteobacteria bacterium]
MTRINLKILGSVALCLIFFNIGDIAAAEFSVILKAEQWDMPRHGESLIKQSELGKIVHYWKDHPDQVIEIRYPGGEEGEVWVRELMDWLVALGIPSSAMTHLPGSGAEDLINLVIVQGTINNE